MFSFSVGQKASAKRKHYDESELPTLAQLANERRRLHYKKRFSNTLFSTVYILIVVAAIAVLMATLFFPVFRVYGGSMAPTVNEGEIIVALKGAAFQSGEVIVLSYNNKLLVKRVIAAPGQWVDIDQDGNVYLDKELLDEPYLSEGAKAFGDCTITLPYQVPDGRYFVMGDNRATSQDSRNAIVGCIAEEQIVGKAIMRVWPAETFGLLNQK